MKPRAVKTLSALFVSLTLGGLFLMVLDVAPIRSPWADMPLAATASAEDTSPSIVKRTSVTLQPLQWQRGGIVIHTNHGEQASNERGCHFIIESLPPGEVRPGQSSVRVRATENWDQQLTSRHLPNNITGYSDSIGICMEGDFSRKEPSKDQMKALVNLIKALQKECNIAPHSVIYYRDLDTTSNSPGDLFPSPAEFDRVLSQG